MRAVASTWVRPFRHSLESTVLLIALCHIVESVFAADVPMDAPPRQSILDPTNHVGVWIWDTTAHAKQTCRFWKAFDVPGSPVARAFLRLTVDNGYRLFLDGREIGRGSDWRTVTEYDLTWLLNPGRHVLAIEGFNDRLEGGVILGLTIELVDQRVIEIASDDTWRVVPIDEPDGWEKRRFAPAHWRQAKVVGAIGTDPWVDWPIGEVTLPTLRPVTLHFWQTGWFQVSLLVICGMAVLSSVWLMGRLAVQSRAQHLLNLERARIARDIHDDFGARLTQLVLLGELARNEVPAGSDARQQVDSICERARDLSHAMDEVVWAVNSRRDTLQDFVSYVCKYAQLFLSSTSIRCRLDVEPGMPPAGFDLPVRRNLFLAVKEALNNVARHSNALEVFIRIYRGNSRLTVVVEDNGHGFDMAGADAQRNGLANMLQRMNQIQGTCLVFSQPGAGCRVEFTVPLPQRSRVKQWLAKLRPQRAARDRPGAAPIPADSRP